MPQEEGNRICSTRPAAPSGIYATKRRKQNMQHRPCSLVRNICHKKKETEHVTRPAAPEEDMPQEEGNRTCSTGHEGQTARHATRRRKQNMQHRP
jgi:hypothetical protein